MSPWKQGLADRLIFPAPPATYDRNTFKKYLCWIPWNEVMSPEKCADAQFADGIPCVWFPATRAAGVMLFFHGNAEDLGMAFGFLRYMRDQFKVNVLACEYPGYGLLGHAPPCEDGLKEVVLTAFRFVVDELKVAYQQVILLGRSIGSGPAVYLASRFPVGGLILVAAFTSVKEVIKSLVGQLVAWAFTERFPNLALIGNVSCPTLFIHGESDSLVPASQTVALFRKCRARKMLITPPNMDHNTNLFTDASFFAIPAINFFGLPGYQREFPPQIPMRFFEEERSLKPNKTLPKNNANNSTQKVPWLFCCSCMENKRTVKGENASDIVALRPPAEQGSRSQTLARDKLLDDLARDTELLAGSSNEVTSGSGCKLFGDYVSNQNSSMDTGCGQSEPTENLSWEGRVMNAAEDDRAIWDASTRASQSTETPPEPPSLVSVAKSPCEAPVIEDEGSFEKPRPFPATKLEGGTSWHSGAERVVEEQREVYI